ncbi:peptide ABC transporter substrate-binding protein [Anaerocolumna xylanovorans]|uniref:Oligopeptide transport system substrate-binding protein n=1 Tax=Anaerocolumna xylanovorans DSM 12503 TaxID=1121345 RepID=A0A1M7XY22_9FIRM|nr:peptide ABC transporter substrate-binding protein [Anaerocolumna xylanovorans]SHO43866.1 oligopeptide transport system substrate-binding protein [Anaerocolumna xylanovorans DSM 12503]
MKRKLYSVILTLILTSTLFLGACSKADNKQADSDSATPTGTTETATPEATQAPTEAEDSGKLKVLNWVAPGEVTTMDSGKSYDTISSEQIDFQADPLYRINEKNEAVPNLAVALPEVSADGLTVTVEIRDNAKFSNGDKITAADIVYAAQRVVDPATGSQSANNLTYIKNAAEIIAGTLKPEELGVKALSDTKLEFTLVAPNSYLNTTLSSTLLSPVSKKFVEEQGKDYGLTSDALLASGPYVLKDWNGTDISWKYVKNPYYWDADNIHFDEINIQVVKEVATGANLYEAGELDGTKVTGEYITLYQGKEDLVSVQTLRMTNLEMGISSNKYLQNENLRKALLYALNREELSTAILNGDGVPSVGVIPNGIAVNPDNGKSIAEDFGVLVYTDVEKAQQFFKQALKELGTDSITLRLVTSDSDESIKIGQYLQSIYETNLPGLKIDLANVPASVRFEEMMSYKFDLALGGWTGDFDPTSYVKQHEEGYEHNHSQWKSEELKNLVTALETADGTDFTKRWEHLKEANQYLIDNAVVIPIVQASQSYLINPKLKGYVTHVLGTPIDITRAYIEE